MNFKFTSLSVVALATTAALSGCSTEEEKIEKVYPFEQASSTAHGSNATGQGLWCKAPDIVQTVDSDFHPLSTQEITDLKAVALAAANSDNDWTDAEIAAWESSFNPYTYDYGTIDLYDTLGLTNEEMARQAVAKEEARAFKIEQGQQEIFDAEGAFEGGFDAWFDTWFATVPYTDYLGKSQRLDKAARGNELALSTANNGEEACYTPPTECPNYKVLDESGAYDCVVPETNPIADAPAPIYSAAANETVVYFRKKGATSADDYSDITIHAWDNGNCTSYGESTAWGTGKGSAGWDANYGIYWVLPLIDGHSSCGNMIIYNKTTSDKYITQNDGMIPLGNSGDVLLHNLDKITYYQEGFPANLMDGLYLGNQHPYFGAAASTKSCGWGTELDEAGEACIGQALDNCPEGAYAVGVGQVDIASKCVADFDTETTFYLRGGFNGWGDPIEGQEFELVQGSGGEYRKIFTYGEHPADAELTFEESASVEVVTSAGATLTFVQPTDEDGSNTDLVLDLNNIPAGTTFTMADGTMVELASDSNVLTLPNEVETPAVEALVMSIPDGSKLTLAAGANHDDFTCTQDCMTNYLFKIADQNWSEPTAYGAIKGEDVLAVGGVPIGLTAGEGVGQDIAIKMQDTSFYQFVFDAKDAGKTTLEVDKVPVNAFPNLVLAEEVIALEYKGKGVYGINKRAMSAGTYTVSFIDEANDFALGADSVSTANVNDEITLKDGGTAITLTIAEDEKYDLFLDLSDLSAPKFKAQPSKPLGANVAYIRGSINDWGAPETDEVIYDETKISYSVIYGLEAATDTHAFKFASEDWAAVDLGYSAVSISDDDDAIAITESGGNMQIVADESTSYKFELSYDADDFTTKPVLKVSKLPIYVRGGMNGWGEEDQMAFNAVDAGNPREAGHEYVKSIELGADNVFFKIATGDWSTINLGSATDGAEAITLDTPVVLGGANDNNLSFDPVTAGTYKFIFNDKTKTLTITQD